MAPTCSDDLAFLSQCKHPHSKLPKAVLVKSPSCTSLSIDHNDPNTTNLSIDHNDHNTTTLSIDHNDPNTTTLSIDQAKLPKAVL
ncbi:hypothetical protein CRG98_016322, partial [Punica granatum]